MAKDKDKKQDDDELDLASLSALVRPSDAPSHDEKDDADSKLDLRALVASVPPPPPVEPEAAQVVVVKAEPVKAEAKRDEAPAKMAKKAGATKKDEKAAPVVATAAAAPAPAPAAGGGMGIGIGLGLGLAIAAVAYFAMNGGAPATTVATADAPIVHADTLAAEAPGAIEERDHESEPAAAPVAPAPTPDEVEDSADDEAAAAESDDDDDVEAAPVEEAAAEESETRRTSGRHRTPRTTTAAAATVAPTAAATTTTAHAPEPTHAATPPPPTTTARRGGGLDSVLDQALGTSRTPPPSTTARAPAGARTAPAGDLPDQPSQTDVRRVLGGMLSQIRGCAGEQVGMVTFTLMVRSDGTVVSSSASGSPFGGTPQGSCMEGVLRGAHFPAFRQAQFRVQYPMRI